MGAHWVAIHRGVHLEDLRPLLLSAIGEIKLLKEVLLPDVKDTPGTKGDDCARVPFTGNGVMLWSIDPCPRPVADMLGLCTPEVWGWYTAVINLSDIAASGGKPSAMLTSLELPADTPVDFVRKYQSGLMSILRKSGVDLLGGNVKAAKRFSATGTAVGFAGPNQVARTIRCSDCYFYVIGESGNFWSAIVAELYERERQDSRGLLGHLRRSLLFPSPQVDAGQRLGQLPFEIACMDCSDGLPNALYQLARMNEIDITVDDDPAWRLSADVLELLVRNNISVQNVCYGFGDWQLACLVARSDARSFEEAMSGFKLVRLAETFSGSGRVRSQGGRDLNCSLMNENFVGGYNSINDVEALVAKFLHQPVFG